MSKIVKIIQTIIFSNLIILFKKGLLFESLKCLTPFIMNYLKPYKHNRLSLILGQEILVDEFYFSKFSLNKRIHTWYKNLKA